ncbi:MAG TPA: glycosyltransferase [Patescibacteria group bacterium]|nr:glycosyltransferase [Patescibacteria group bacterium]
MDNIFLSVVVPCYNEMANLQKGVLEKIAHYLSRQKFAYEVLIVDDGSTDGSISFIEHFIKDEPKFKLIKNSHLGKAGTVTAGMLKGKGEWRLFCDMDQAAPIDELSKLLPFAKDGFDVIIGSRSNQRKNAPFTRQIMANGMIILRKIVIGLYDIKDTQCGFKMFSAKASEVLFGKLSDVHNGFSKIKGSNVTAGFDIELLYIARKNGFRVKEVPVEWLYVESRRVNPISDSIEGVIELFKIRANILKGVYEG